MSSVLTSPTVRQRMTNDERRRLRFGFYTSFVVCRLSVGVVVLAVVAVYFAVVTTCGEVSDRQQGVATST